MKRKKKNEERKRTMTNETVLLSVPTSLTRVKTKRDQVPGLELYRGSLARVGAR